MDALALIGEQRIREALERGELDDNPLAGRPLELEDLNGMPDELRLGYLLLRTTGHATPHLAGRREGLTLHELIEAFTSGADAPTAAANAPTAAQWRWDRLRAERDEPADGAPSIAEYAARTRARLGSDPTRT